MSAARELRAALVRRDLDAVERIIARDPDCVNQRAHPVPHLYTAACWGFLEGVELLIEKGAHLDATSAEGVSALMIAVKMNHDEIALLLLEAGADVNKMTSSGDSALHCALRREWNKASEVLFTELIRSGAKLTDQRDLYGDDSALALAAKLGRISAVLAMIDRGVPQGAVRYLTATGNTKEQCTELISKFPKLDSISLIDCEIPTLMLSLRMPNMLAIPHCRGGFDVTQHLNLSVFHQGMTFIDLSHNGIRRLPLSFFELLPNVKELRLEGNLLKALPAVCLMTSLARLDLRANELEFSPLPVPPTLTNVSLQSNPCCGFNGSAILWYNVGDTRASVKPSQWPEPVQSIASLRACCLTVIKRNHRSYIKEYIEFEVLFCASRTCMKLFYGSRLQVHLEDKSGLKYKLEYCCRACCEAAKQEYRQSLKD